MTDRETDENPRCLVSADCKVGMCSEFSVSVLTLDQEAKAPVHLFDFCYLLLIFFTVPQGMWDFSYLTRDRTHAPCIGSMES